MTLEDFFTLNELKDGLTAPDRVKELITVMQRENDSIVKNFGEATRQRSIVATTVAATENKNCLDLFIHLNGLYFIDTWLKDVQKLGDDTGNVFLEESIIALLRTLERLQIDNQRLSSSGIGRTVQNLVAHSSSVVCTQAKALCDRWMLIQDNDVAPQDVKSPDVANFTSHGNDNDEKNAERPRDETMSLVSADTIQRVIVNNETTTPDKIMDQEPLDRVEVKERYGSTTPIVQGSTYVGQLDVSQLDKHVKDENEINCRVKADSVEMSTLSSHLEQIASSADVDNALDSSIKTDLRGDEDEDMVDDGESSDHFRTTMSLKTRNQAGVSAANALQDLREAEGLKTSSNSESGNAKENGLQSIGNSGNGSNFFKISMNARGDGVTSKTLDMELDYGMIDPLEVARQVFIEVQREVDSRERSCSTSEKMSGGGSERPNTPDSTNCKESPPVEDSDKEVTSGSEKMSSGGSERPSAAEPAKDAETLVSERESCKADITASQISEIAQESEANTGRGISGFDLNQEVCSEEVDNPINPVSSTVSVVSASRAVAASGLPSAPLQFEGTLGWKGSASTSAFRRIPDSSRAHNNSKQRLDCLDIDLNVAEDSEDKIEDFLSRNKVPVIFGLPSGEESSVEASPRRPERMQFDLNSIGDEGADTVGMDWRRDGRVASINQNGWQSPSRSSSSSSKQPSLRNIDLNLNERPVFPYGASLDHPYLGKSSNHEESVFPIFGTKVEVKTKDSLPQPSGRILEPPVDFNLRRPGAGLGLESCMNYGNPPFYGHNGFAPGAGAAIRFIIWFKRGWTLAA
ncbi:hypothetical protein L6452_04792 [Arctium lappa]|uniref:Uncharacterized protein n=1 Tax=Arctium lappa TaxID=4217 RepID=A0ACB9EFB1_ARCLA|nr:hypothetical protein L6452_04792 [Arctium lappa]